MLHDEDDDHHDNRDGQTGDATFDATGLVFFALRDEESLDFVELDVGFFSVMNSLLEVVIDAVEDVALVDDKDG